MQTSLHHPRQQIQRQQFYAWTCAIKQSSGGGWDDVTGLESLACAYVPGGVPGSFQASAPSRDRVLLPDFYPQINASHRLVLDIAGQDKWFLIAAALPTGGGTQTLLLVQPLD